MEGERQSEAARAEFDRLAATFAADGSAKVGKMFGHFGLTIGGKAAVCLFHDELVFKLTAPDHAAALALPGAHLWDPSDMGRPMREWVQVPADQRTSFPGLARAALDYVATQAGAGKAKGKK